MAHGVTVPEQFPLLFDNARHASVIAPTHRSGSRSASPCQVSISALMRYSQPPSGVGMQPPPSGAAGKT